MSRLLTPVLAILNCFHTLELSDGEKTLKQHEKGIFFVPLPCFQDAVPSQGRKTFVPFPLWGIGSTLFFFAFPSESRCAGNKD